MPRKQSPVLTDLELIVMNVLWDKGSATTREVLDSLAKEHSFAYTTVSTILTILGRKGFVTHRKKNKAFIYRPVVTHEEMINRAVKELTKKFFGDSKEALIQFLCEPEVIASQKIAPVEKTESKPKLPVTVDDVPEWF